MPGRKYSALNSNYRYGYNGQEKSTENCGCGDTYTAQYWEYDSRIVRRWNIDPVEDIGISPYAVNRNNPILYSDPKGDCPFCPFLFGFIAGAIAEIVEQTVSNGLTNLAQGKGFFDDWAQNIDINDVLMSGVQGGMMAQTGGGLATYAVLETVGNVEKSAVDFTSGNGLQAVYAGKTEDKFFTDMAANTAGSIVGGLKVGDAAAELILKNKTAQQLLAAPIDGALTGQAEGAVGVAFTPIPLSKNNSSAASSPTKKSSTKTSAVKSNQQSNKTNKTPEFVTKFKSYMNGKGYEDIKITKLKGGNYEYSMNKIDKDGNKTQSIGGLSPATDLRNF